MNEFLKKVKDLTTTKRQSYMERGYSLYKGQIEERAKSGYTSADLTITDEMERKHVVATLREDGFTILTIYDGGYVDINRVRVSWS